MRTRLVIAAQTGVVVGLLCLSLYLARQLNEAHRQLAGAWQPSADLPTNGARPTRLRLQQLPPINLPTRVEQLDWHSVESDDYATYVANLRRIGCPEDTIRDIITADVNQLFAARRRDLLPPPKDWEYWLNPADPLATENPSDEARDREASLDALEAERRQMLASLLGPGAVRAEFQELVAEALLDRSLQFLPESKRQAVAEAQARYRQELEKSRLATTDDASRRELDDAVAKTYSDALAANLTPAEREQLEMRTSPIADALRDKLRGFGGTREEFEKLFRLESDYAQERARLESAATAGSDPQAAERLEAASLELDQKIKETLGPQRYADYQRGSDPDYQTLNSLALQHDVPTTVANQVWEMRHAVENQTDQIRQNPLLTAEQKIRALEAIRDETKTAIVEVLGEPLLDEYSRQGGRWLTELTDTERLGETGLEIVPPPLPETTVADSAPPGFIPIRPDPQPPRRNRRTR